MATQLDIPAYNDENDELTALVAKLLLGKLRCHLGITCDSCLRMNFFGYRYKCAVCDNYDLCSDCFEDRKQSGDHKTNHPLKVIRSPDVYSRFSTLFGLGLPILQLLLLEKNATHDVSCNSCDDGNPVKGILFICDDCRGYRLCYSCFEAEKVTGSHERFHCLLIRVTPRSYRIQGSNITLIKKLGAGSFGEVYRCTINGVTAAIKLCNTKDLTTLSGKERQSLENEIQIYQEFFCNYIVEIKGFGEGSGNKLFLVLEYLSEGNLEEHMKKQSYARVSKRRRFYFCENIIRGLFRMHRKGIIHKDLKPDNIFLTDNDTLKLGDLGIAFNPDSTSQGVKRIHQQLYYPTNDPNSSHPSYDIYAFGLLVNEIMTGQRNTKLSPEDCKEAEKVPYFGDMIAACISQNGRDRPTTACVKQHLLNFHQYLDKQSKQNEKKYEQETLERRNEIFDKAYQSFSAQVRFANEVDDAYQERPLPQATELDDLLRKILLLEALKEMMENQGASKLPNQSSLNKSDPSSAGSTLTNQSNSNKTEYPGQGSSGSGSTLTNKPNSNKTEFPVQRSSGSRSSLRNTSTAGTGNSNGSRPTSTISSSQNCSSPQNSQQKSRCSMM